MILLISFAGAILVLSFLALLTALAGHWLSLADQLRKLLRATALDVVQVRSSLDQAQIDAETQRAKLEYGQELAQLKLTQRQIQTGKVQQ